MSLINYLIFWEATVTKSPLIIAAMFIAAFAYLIHEDSAAMEQCRQNHSEETCFYLLNH